MSYVLIIPNFAHHEIETEMHRFLVSGSAESPKFHQSSAVKALLGCHNGLFTLPLRPRCNATTAPLQPREALTANPAKQKWGDFIAHLRYKHDYTSDRQAIKDTRSKLAYLHKKNILSRICEFYGL